MYNVWLCMELILCRSPPCALLYKLYSVAIVLQFKYCHVIITLSPYLCHQSHLSSQLPHLSLLSLLLSQPQTYIEPWIKPCAHCCPLVVDHHSVIIPKSTQLTPKCIEYWLILSPLNSQSSLGLTQCCHAGTLVLHSPLIDSKWPSKFRMPRLETQVQHIS